VASPMLKYDGAQDPLKVSLLPNPSHLGTPSNQYYSLRSAYIKLILTQRRSIPSPLARLVQSSILY
jgi:hypothetical protein